MARLHNTVADKIKDFHRGCHVQFRHETEEGLRVVHGRLESFSIGVTTVLLSLARINSDTPEHFVVNPKTGVTFVVPDSPEEEGTP